MPKFFIYDGFADSGALVDRAARMGFGERKITQDQPHFLLEYSSHLSHDWVGGKALASGHRMILLAEGVRTLTLEDQYLKCQAV